MQTQEPNKINKNIWTLQIVLFIVLLILYSPFLFLGIGMRSDPLPLISIIFLLVFEVVRVALFAYVVGLLIKWIFFWQHFVKSKTAASTNSMHTQDDSNYASSKDSKVSQILSQKIAESISTPDAKWPLWVFTILYSIFLISTSVFIFQEGDYSAGFVLFIIGTMITALALRWLYSQHAKESFWKYISCLTIACLGQFLATLLYEVFREGHLGSMADMILIGFLILLLAGILVSILVGVVLHFTLSSETAKKIGRYFFITIYIILFLIVNGYIVVALIVTNVDILNDNKIINLQEKAKMDIQYCDELLTVNRQGSNTPELLSQTCHLRNSNFTTCSSVYNADARALCESLKAGSAVAGYESSFAVEFEVQFLALLAKGARENKTCEEIQQLIVADTVFYYNDTDSSKPQSRLWMRKNVSDGGPYDLCTDLVTNNCLDFDRRFGVPYCRLIREAIS